jgi:hypothetical protein
MAKEELLSGVGQLKVSCLKIVEETVRIMWVYKSSGIIKYLEGLFGKGLVKLV